MPETSLAWDSTAGRRQTSLRLDAADEATTARRPSWPKTLPRVSFVYLGGVDITGHVTGAGGAYRAAARAADQRVGRLLGAVLSRRSYQRENWTIVVVTDHGHLDGGRARRPRARGHHRVGGRRRTRHPAGRPAADHPPGRGGAAGPRGSRLATRSSVSAQARTTAVPTAAPPTASVN